MELTETTEQEFRTFIRHFEGDPLFVSLRDSGHIAKVSLRGRIPRDKYDAYADVEMIRLIRAHGISDKADWFQELSSSEAVRNPYVFAKEYGVDASIIRRVSHYLRRLDFDDAPTYSSVELDLDRVGDDRQSFVSLEENDPAEVCSEFVERFEVSAEAFVTAFLADEPDAAEIADRFGAPIADVRRVLESIAGARLFEAFSGPVDTSAAPAPAPSEESIVIATVTNSPRTGIPILSVDPDGVYAETYRLTASGIDALYGIAGDAKTADQLLVRLRLINQHKTLLCRLITALFKRQFHYFSTGDELRLKPFAQAELSRELDEHASTISRAIRNKNLRFRDTERSLQWYCQKKRDVVGRVVSANPQRHDSEIASLLRKHYGCTISRRTVNYHRQQTDKTISP